MGHHIQGFVLASTLAPALRERLTGGAVTVPVGAGMTFIPLTHRVHDALQESSPDPATRRDGFLLLSGAVERVAARVSALGPVAYIETEYFGGIGEQAAAVWREGEIRLVRSGARGAINEALAMLGVERSWRHDEFDAVGLGQYRHMDDWNYDE